MPTPETASSQDVAGRRVAGVPVPQVHIPRPRVPTPHLPQVHVPQVHVPLPSARRVLPSVDPRSTRGRILWIGGLSGLAVIGAIDWPVAVAVAAGTWVAEQRARAYAREAAEPGAQTERGTTSARRPAARTTTRRPATRTRKTTASSGTGTARRSPRKRAATPSAPEETISEA